MRRKREREREREERKREGEGEREGERGREGGRDREREREREREQTERDRERLRHTMADSQLLEVLESEGSLGGEFEAGGCLEGVLQNGAELSQSLQNQLPGQSQQVQDPGGCGSHDHHMTFTIKGMLPYKRTKSRTLLNIECCHIKGLNLEHY